MVAVPTRPTINHWPLIPTESSSCSNLTVPVFWLQVLLAGRTETTPPGSPPSASGPPALVLGVRLLWRALGLMDFAALPIPSCYKALA